MIIVHKVIHQLRENLPCEGKYWRVGNHAVSRWAFFQGLVDAGLSGIVLKTTKVASAGDVAYGRGRYTLTISPPAGPTVQDAGKYIVGYRRQADVSWRAVDDIFNSNNPAQ